MKSRVSPPDVTPKTSVLSLMHLSLLRDFFRLGNFYSKEEFGGAKVFNLECREQDFFDSIDFLLSHHQLKQYHLHKPKNSEMIIKVLNK
jgi:hypothetical protein